ncbi:hypothetical protein D4A92_21490 [Rhizobium rosettiformans]|uniref:Uncharacterized protein n=1 Tax=Rhizobium rosettiformans TaxID=1368430 RepID=A0ABX7F0V1_9HYPH|nr:hypothetical protein D4A92_21490 [Rhizobium rosettiformans]
MSAHDFKKTGTAKVSVSEADLYVSDPDGRVARPSVVTVTDTETGVIKSFTVQEAHDGQK